MFTATLAKVYHRSNALTIGRAYEVIDFNDYFGTYLILNDEGQRSNIGWDMFEDRGRAAEEYSRKRAA